MSLGHRTGLLSPRRVALVRARLQQQGLAGSGAGESRVGMARVSREGELPLSFAQQRLWFLAQLEPDSPFYNLPAAFRLKGDLDVRALQNSLDEMLRRHESLRTRFHSVQGRPSQLIEPELPLPLPVLDLSHLPLSEDQRDSEVRSLAFREASAPFDLAKAPLVRARLFRLAPDDHVLLLCLHHIVADGWSIGIFSRELALLYQAFSQGKHSPLPPLPIQYADFAHWQRSYLQGDVLQNQIDFWKRQLHGAPPLLELPTDRPRPHLQTHQGAAFSFDLDPTLARKIHSLARTESATLFMVLLAGFQALLSRYSGSNDVSIGSPIANRNRLEIESLIGMFVNTLVLRTDLSGNPSFHDLVQRVKDSTLAAHSQQDLPFEILVDALQPPRSVSHTPLFQVLFALQNAPRSEISLPGLLISSLPIQHTTAKFDLALHVDEPLSQNHPLHASFEFNTSLFDPDTVARMARHLANLLDAACSDPQAPLHSLPLLDPDEKHSLLVDWNQTHSPLPNSCLHQLFETQAQLNPDAPALAWRDERLSYGELDRRANRLAHRLQGLGVGPESRVALCLERSTDAVVSILAVLKAGGAYVPLDPRYPQQRLRVVLEEAGPALVITTPALHEMLDVRVPALCLDADAGVETEPDSRPVSRALPENLAYVLYTSGSTGRPKGVAIPHRAAVNFVTWAGASFSTEELACVLASTSFSFDLSLFELFAPLARGGQVVLAENALEAPALAGTHALSLVNTVPSVLAEMLRLGGLSPATRTINLAGEPLPLALARQVRAESGVTRLLNLYGPTETTTYSSFAEVQADAEAAPGIGRPIANTEILILDPGLEPVPVGVPGELYIGGAGLARGYLSKPDLTAARFVPHPWSPTPGARLYRTGDRARFRADGSVEFLGRLDHQVKLRGFRIELAEVETALAEHPRVAGAVAMVREDVPGDRRLVAYVVLRGEAPPALELRGFLQQRLPEYMLPSSIVVLAGLPVTPNGKLDRGALPAPERERPGDGAVTPPRTELEAAVARIWSEVLGVDTVGVHDDFFELGGHSLLATQLLARIRAEFQVNLPLRRMFEASTVAGLASLLAEAREAPMDRTEGPRSCLVVVQEGGPRQRLFCVHPIGGSALPYLDLARELGPDQPVLAFEAPGLEGDREPIGTIEALAEEYVARMREAQAEGPYALLGWSLGGIVAFEMASALRRHGQEVALLALLDCRPPAADAVLPVEGRLAAGFLGDLAALLGLSLPWTSTELSALDPDEQLVAVLQEARAARLLPHDFGLRQMRRRLDVFRANARAAVAYRPRPYPGRLALFRAEESQDPSGQWEPLAEGGVEGYSVPGTHYTMMRAPHVASLARALRGLLDKAAFRRTPGVRPEGLDRTA